MARSGKIMRIQKTAHTIEHTLFEGLAQQLGLGETVRFLGAVPDAELPALYNAADLYVGASRRVELLAEGFGISLVEALCCHSPR